MMNQIQTQRIPHVHVWVAIDIMLQLDFNANTDIDEASTNVKFEQALML